MVSSPITKHTTTNMDQHDIPILGNFYTKAEVDKMVAAQLLFGGKEDLLYAKKNESTGKYDIIRVR